MERWIKYIALFATMAFLQVLVFSQIDLFGMVNAFPYIYFIIILPFDINGRNILTLSAILGILVDFLSGTMGVHMLAMVMGGYARTLLLPALAPQGDYEVGTSPSVNDYGWGWFTRYALLITIIHHLTLFIIESFTFAHFGLTLANALLSTVLTLVTMLIFQSSIRNR